MLLQESAFQRIKFTPSFSPTSAAWCSGSLLWPLLC